jgi:hypothetical protein
VRRGGRDRGGALDRGHHLARDQLDEIVALGAHSRFLPWSMKSNRFGSSAESRFLSRRPRVSRQYTHIDGENSAST